MFLSLIHFNFQVQTKSTLDFAQRAKKIVQHAHVNEILDERAQMNRQRKEIADLKIQLEQLQKSGLNELTTELEAENLLMKQKNAELLKKLQDQFLSSTIAGNYFSILFGTKYLDSRNYGDIRYVPKQNLVLE